jgi:hypothetical protein
MANSVYHFNRHPGAEAEARAETEAMITAAALIIAVGPDLRGFT